jgi:hypothetical protein
MPDMFKYSPAFKQSHLFRDLDDLNLAWVLDLFEERPCEEETEIITQGQIGDRFFYIIRGKVRFSVRTNGKQTRSLGFLGPNDYFGETALLRKQARSATAVAEAGTMLLQMSASNFRKLTQKFPVLQERFEFVAASRTQALRQRFNWLQEDETVYYLSRKNLFVLYRMLAIPLLIFAGVLLAAAAFLMSGVSLTSLGLIGLPLLASAGWAIWRFVDWGNDFYIITNRRVVWVEKVVALYDSRQESALRTILSVDVQSSAIGRIFDFGDVVVRTFTGKIVFSDINNPRLAESMIKEYWERTKSEVQRESTEGLRKTLRQTVNPPPPPPLTPQPPKKAAVVPPPVTGLQPLYFEHFLRMQFQGGEVTTYRKHIYILVRNSPLPIPALIGGGVGWYLLLGGNLTTGLILVGLLFVLVIALWWIYMYVDWANDLYLVTTDQVVDIYRKPLGQEVRKSAPLENILSVQYKRQGITGLIFNFGTVFISVGDIQLDFIDVFNPPMVQQEITNRMTQRIAKKKEADTAEERKRMTDWLNAYHDVEKELREMDKRPGPE